MRTSLVINLIFLSYLLSAQEQIVNSTLTSDGIGEFKLGSSFSELLELHNSELLITGSDGYYWNAVKVNLGNNEWIIFVNRKEAIEWKLVPSARKPELSDQNYFHFSKSDQNNKIRAIRTNSTRIKTNSQIQVGSTIEEIQQQGYEISVFSDLSGLNLEISELNLIFKVSKIWEENYFDEGGNFPNNLNVKATISELKIIGE